jgi:hypothetical protein
MVRVELRDAHLSIKELVQTGMIRHTDTKKTVLLYLPGQESASRCPRYRGSRDRGFLAAFNAVELTRCAPTPLSGVASSQRNNRRAVAQ